MTSANEIAEWLHVQLNVGMSQSGVRVVEESVIKETHDPVNGYPSTSSYLKRPVIPVTYDYSKYAMGWRTGFYRGIFIFKQIRKSVAKSLNVIPHESTIFVVYIDGSGIENLAIVYFDTSTAALHGFLFVELITRHGLSVIE